MCKFVIESVYTVHMTPFLYNIHPTSTFPHIHQIREQSTTEKREPGTKPASTEDKWNRSSACHVEDVREVSQPGAEDPVGVPLLPHLPLHLLHPHPLRLPLHHPRRPRPLRPRPGNPHLARGFRLRHRLLRRPQRVKADDRRPLIHHHHHHHLRRAR
uniref:Uncharacterized protein n=1 Tax=Kalanchoe fedtschenkoi TaxID=63787 RepID=A0A7N0TJT7_KALFE